MKLSGARLDAFLKAPDAAIKAVLVFGPDRGLVRERADALVGAVAGDVRDPFRVVSLEAAAIEREPFRLADEAAALALGGGRRVVVVRAAGERFGPTALAFLEGPPGDALVVVEAASLPARSGLRKAFEAAADAAAIACYADSADGLAQVIDQTLAAHGLSAPADVVAWLTESLGADRSLTRAELGKLALYMGRPGRVTLADAIACVGDAAAVSLDVVALAATAGDGRTLDRALARAFAEGATPVGVLRAAARHVQRLHLAAALVAAGKSPQQAMAALRPPVVYPLQERFRAHLQRWSAERLARALDILTEAELECKTTGRPDEAICGRALMRIASAAPRAG